jgi:AcrR family transcriptional regulator
MPSDERFAARDALDAHLNTFDWTSQSPTKVRILEAFLQLTTAHGFDAVSMRMIAKVVNIKPPSIYSHFEGGKDEIVTEALRWYFYQFGRALLDEVNTAEDADQFWDGMVRVHFARQVELPESNLWDLLVATDRMVGILPPSLRAEVAVWLDLHEDMYGAAARDLGFFDTVNAVKVVIALLESATRWADWDGTESSLAEQTERAIALSRSILRDQSQAPSD